MNLQEIQKYIISLPNRTHRLERTVKELSYLYSDSSFNLTPGVVMNPVFVGIANAHMNCIKDAINKGYENVCIMEDDLMFQAKNNTLQYVNDAFNNLPEDWDLLLGGVYYSQKLTNHNEYWNKTDEFCALTFYVVNQKAYSKILEYDNTNHIDRYMALKGLNCYVTKKFFVRQYNGFSDNVQSEVNYDNHLFPFDLLK